MVKEKYGCQTKNNFLMQHNVARGKKSYDMHIKESQIRFLTKTNKLDGFMIHVNISASTLR